MRMVRAPRRVAQAWPHARRTVAPHASVRAASHEGGCLSPAGWAHGPVRTPCDKIRKQENIWGGCCPTKIVARVGEAVHFACRWSFFMAW